MNSHDKINHNTSSDLSGDVHPIPIEHLESADMIVRKKDGSVELCIIVNGYLDNSPYTERRVIDKIDNYLAFINGDEFIEDFGEPSFESTKIILNCNLQPHSSIYELIKAMKDHVKLFNASIMIECK